MIIAEASIRMPAVYVSHLFGDPRKPRVVTVRLGLLTVIWMGREARNVLMEAAWGISGDPEWWEKNHRTIRTARARAERFVYRHLSKQEKAIRSAVQSEMAEQKSELEKLRSENWKLREAFKLLGKDG